MRSRAAKTLTKEEKEILILMGSRLKKIREKGGLSLKDLSITSGIDLSKIAKIEKGQINVTIVTFYHLCKGLGVDFQRTL